jgi:two-component system response regulator RpfG
MSPLRRIHAASPGWIISAPESGRGKKEVLMPFSLNEDTIETLPAPMIVIIDAEFTSREVIGEIVRGLRPDTMVKAFSDTASSLEWIRENQADLVIMDHIMDSSAGLEALQRMKHIPCAEDVPILVVTSPEQRDSKKRSLEAGATDTISKPIDPVECRARCANMLNLRMQKKIIMSKSQLLEQRIDDATGQIRAREQETLFRLAKAGEYRDEETGNHIIRMAKYSRLIAEQLGLEASHCDLIESAAPMHDIGKIGIPDQILRKPGKLSPEEFTIMKTHPLIGFRILQDSPSKYLMLGATIALAHHEKYDGTGYPYGSKGEKIPLEARIVAVADVYDVLTSYRPYKAPWSSEDSLEYLTANRGKHFDPLCVDAFIAQFSKVEFIQNQLRDVPETTLVRQRND